MEMKIMNSEHRRCPCCMEIHDVYDVLINEEATFKNKKVFFDAEYTYCEKTDELFASEKQMQNNSKLLRDAYRREEGLLTSEEIIEIRKKYAISQSDLCLLLGWGGKTITRYEGYQVQDRAHDAILRKIGQDPEWFLSLLDGAKEKLTADSYAIYLEKASSIYEEEQDIYLRKVVEAEYARYRGDLQLHGNTELSLDKVVDVIRYFAAHINNLYKVRLMKLMWYADALSFKERGFAVTGLVYVALPMGAVPVGHNSIINLKGIPCEEVEIEDSYGYRFSLANDLSFPNLNKDDLVILAKVVDKLGSMRKDDLVKYMHKEQAYIETPPREAIQFKYAESLQI